MSQWFNLINKWSGSISNFKIKSYEWFWIRKGMVLQKSWVWSRWWFPHNNKAYFKRRSAEWIALEAFRISRSAHKERLQGPNSDAK